MRRAAPALWAGILSLLPALALAAGKPAAPAVERNVIYGMHSGAALLLDVYHPAKPNGFGVVFVAGSGWQADPSYGARPIKESQVDVWGPPLTDAGYTVFAVNHRGAPGFHFPAALEDVQRAIRFVRANARHYGIDGAKLGGLGGSSGGNLIALAAMRAEPGRAESADLVSREPATLQAIVLRAPVVDLRNLPTPQGAYYVVSYMETPPGDSPAAKALYEAASPVTQVKPGAPPTLLIHGDADSLIPFQQSVDMEAALRRAGSPAQLLDIPGGEHGADFGGAGRARADWPNYFAATVAWFDRHLRGQKP